MKEATGELNMTVITVVAIAAVGLIFTLFVWPNIQANMMMNTACSNVDMYGNYEQNKAEGHTEGSSQEGTITCVDFTCTATYNGKAYTKQCGNKAGE